MANHGRASARRQRPTQRGGGRGQPRGWRSAGGSTNQASPNARRARALDRRRPDFARSAGRAGGERRRPAVRVRRAAVMTGSGGIGLPSAAGLSRPREPTAAAPGARARRRGSQRPGGERRAAAAAQRPAQRAEHLDGAPGGAGALAGGGNGDAHVQLGRAVVAELTPLRRAERERRRASWPRRTTAARR